MIGATNLAAGDGLLLMKNDDNGMQVIPETEV